MAILEKNLPLVTLHLIFIIVNFIFYLNPRNISFILEILNAILKVDTINLKLKKGFLYENTDSNSYFGVYSVKSLQLKTPQINQTKLSFL